MQTARNACRYRSNAQITGELMDLSRKITDSISGRPEYSVMKYPWRDISGEEFLSMTASCASALKQKGIRPGEWVAVCSLSTAEATAAALACHHIGATVLMINPLLSEERIRTVLCDNAVRVIFVHEELHGKIRQALERSSIETEVILSYTDSMPASLKLMKGFGILPKTETEPAAGTEAVTWSGFVKAADCSDVRRALADTEEKTDPEAPALVVWSSGSTGEPKGIILSERALLAELRITECIFATTVSEDPIGILQNMWSATTYIMLILAMLAMPRRIIIPAGQSLAYMIAKQQASIVFSTADGLLKCTASGSLDGTDLSGLKLIVCGGERTLPAAEKAVNDYFREHGCRCGLSDSWGLSEFSSILTDNIIVNRKGSVGKPFGEVRIEAFDPDHPSEPLERGHTGELFVISPAVMSGYYEDEEATEAFFFTDKDGKVWGRSGDAGYVDDDGFVYVYGRRDSVFFPDGASAVYPSEIENVLAEDARVLGCAVVLDKESGAVTAHIHASVSDENEQDALSGSLRELALKRLPEKSRPAGYVYWPEGLPINECGKTDRKKLENC